MISSKQWTKEEIQEFIDNTNFGYQKIEMPYGLYTPGKAREKTTNLILNDIKGKTLLDVGSYLGYFCVKAAKKGAKKVEGWEIDNERIETARTIAKINQLDINYNQIDIEAIETIKPSQKFDYVICLNLLHHLINPIAALDKLIEMTEDTLVLEIASVGSHDRRKLGLSFLTGLIMSRLPTIIVGKGATSIPYDRQQKFFFTKGALDNILRYQRNCFADVQMINSEFKNRFLVIARKRKIKHLVIVAGPTSSGKSTLIKKLVSDRQELLNKETGIQSFQDWEFIGANSLREYKKTKIEKLVFHYDFLRPFGRSAKTHDRDEALHIVKEAENVTVITLDVSSERLKAQLIESEFYKKDAKSLGNTIEKIYRKIKKVSIFDLIKKVFDLRFLYNTIIKGSSSRHRKILSLYENHKSIKNQYRSWFEFISQLDNKSVQSIIFDNQHESIRSLGEWENDY